LRILILMKQANASYYQLPFLFENRYRIFRHAIFWLIHVIVFTYLFFRSPDANIPEQLSLSLLWVPAMMAYCYPVMYFFVPRFLLLGKYKEFILAMILWAFGGWLFNYSYRMYFMIPLSVKYNWTTFGKVGWAPGSYLTLNTMMGIGCTIVLFKNWIKKQQEWMRAEKDKVSAELQLLKAQLHPHFLFNTLNNIYSSSLEYSPKTPQLILRLSSLLSYMLYDCKPNLVFLDKEIEVMRDYIELEKERYGNRIEISFHKEGDTAGIMIAPLLLLPFLENAFKHGTSEQLEKPWLRFDLNIKDKMINCKIVNSKNQQLSIGQQGIGIQNVKKRLSYLYPGKHGLKINDELDFFVVSLWLYPESADHSMTDDTYLKDPAAQEKISI
jgi:two-component system, LytTR family, sensor histidine kinase AlgZ